jgi:hypothetical protein
MQTLDLILKNKEYKKVLDKVYKGWLVKADQQQKAKGKQQEPDPETQGFEQGLQQYFAGKGQLPQMPSQLQGYRMPQAGPQQMMQNISNFMNAQQMMKDPRYGLKTQLTPEELRESEYAAGPGKIEAEREHYHAQAIAAAALVRKADLAVKEQELKNQKQQLENELAKTKGEQGKAVKEKDLQIKNAMLDIYRTKLKILLANPPGTPKPKEPPAAMLKQSQSADQAVAYIDSILSTRGDQGFTSDDVTMLTGILNQAGASALARTLPKWLARQLPTWIGGSGKEDVQGLRDAVSKYATNLTSTIEGIRHPGTAKQTDDIDVILDEGSTTPDEGPAEGETDEPAADIEITPEDMGVPSKPN